MKLTIENIEDTLNLYAVHHGYRRGTWIQVDNPLVKKLGLHYNTHLKGSDNFINLGLIVTKDPLKFKEVDDKKIGQILSYPCIHKGWDNEYIPRVICIVNVKNRNGEQLNLFSFTCVFSKMNLDQTKKVTEYMTDLVNGYKKILRILKQEDLWKVDSFMYVEHNIKQDENYIESHDTGRMSPKQYLRWRESGKPLPSRQSYIFK